MDFEEESNLHIYGEHLCLIQIYDGREYYIVDAWTLKKDEAGVEALKTLLESPVPKIMFGCLSDASICRKTLGIELKNVYDVRIPAFEMGYTGGLNILVSELLGIEEVSSGKKHRFQRANWTVRPLSDEQIEYALSDVAHLIDLKEILEEKLVFESAALRSKVRGALRHCAEARHREKAGWEKIPGYKLLSKKKKIYLKYFFIARDSIARNRNVPPGSVLDKNKLGKWRKRKRGEEFWKALPCALDLFLKMQGKKPLLKRLKKHCRVKEELK